MAISEIDFERLSALADGELGELELRALLKRASDPELRVAWDQIQRIGCALRKEAEGPASLALADAVRSRVEALPRSRFTPSVAAAASLAAAVALVTVLAYRQFIPFADESSQGPFADVGRPEGQVVQAVDELEAPSGRNLAAEWELQAVVAKRGRTVRPLKVAHRERLRNYMVIHHGDGDHHPKAACIHAFLHTASFKTIELTEQ